MITSNGCFYWKKLFNIVHRLTVSPSFRRVNSLDCEEDETMNSGKLDEELSRLDRIIDMLTPHSLLLMNEPFASTTEREGSVIAKDLLTVCSEVKLKVFIVTHFFELADWAYSEKREHTVFLSPERSDTGKRSYKLKESKPQPTSFGDELYMKVIQEETVVT